MSLRATVSEGCELERRSLRALANQRTANCQDVKRLRPTIIYSRPSHCHLDARHSPLLHLPFPLCASPECCRQHGPPPQWHCEVRAQRPSRFPELVNTASSETLDGTAAFARREHRLYIVHIFEPCSTCTAEPGSRRWWSRYTTPNEGSAARSAVAQPGGEEGRNAICSVCELFMGRTAFDVDAERGSRISTTG